MKVESVETATKFFKRLGASVLPRENNSLYLKLPGWNSGEIYAERDFISFARGWKSNDAFYKKFDTRRAQAKREEEPAKLESMRKRNLHW